MPNAIALILMAAMAVPGLALAAPGDAEDRYGPPPAPFVDPGSPDTAPHMLTWPGKAPAASRPGNRADRTVEAPPPYPRMQPPMAVAALPTSLYAPPPSPLSATLRAAQPVSQSASVASPTQAHPVQAAPSQGATSGQPPRFYSLHREFGLAPDPAPVPLPSQFFAPNADLAEPPPRVVPAGQKGKTASARARADTTDPDAAPAALDNPNP